MSRGIRNNNPGNIEAGIDWDGLATPLEMTDEQKAEDRFAVFRHPVYGIRAMARILSRYQSKHQLKTIREMVNRWAPHHENPTKAYATYVAKHVGVDIDDELVLSFRNLQYMIRAMIKFENGQQPYTWEVETGIFMAGIER